MVTALELGLNSLVLFMAFSVAMIATHPNLRSSLAGTTSAAFVFALAEVLPIAALGLSESSHRRRVRSLLAQLCAGLLLGALICYAAFAAFPDRDLFRNALPDALLLGGLGLALVRLLLTSSLQLDRLRHRVLVLGTGQDAAAVERAFHTLPGAGVTLVGFYPVDSGNPTGLFSKPVLSSALSLDVEVDRLNVDEIIVAVREQRGGTLPLTHLLNCRLGGIRVTDMSAFFERVTGEVPVDSLKASWLIYGDGFRQGWARRMMKRSFDMLAAFLLLVVAAPVMIAAAIAIYFESGRPIIFRQERVGLGGRTFLLLKFRSMCADAEKDGVPKWASTGDARVTRVGQFLRRSRIDELPQIFNVLKGEMSFVGPRPERPYFVAQLSEQVPFYGARHTVKPGLTGWAQVRYSYGASVEDSVRKLQYDLYYIKNHTLLLDLMVLCKTVKVVLRGDGAR